MEGKFTQKKVTASLVLTLLCSLYCIGNAVFKFITSDSALGSAWIFLTVGALTLTVTLLSWLLNYRAYIRIEDDRITAKYHLFGKLNCKVCDVSFALAQTNTLILQLKNGRSYTVMGIKNSWELASEIRRSISFDLTDSPQMLVERLCEFRALRKKYITYIIAFGGSLILDIVLTVLLTGERDLYQFTQRDWVIFTVMGIIGVAVLTAAFVLAQKAGKLNIPIERTVYELRRRTVETTPLLPGNAVSVHADLDYIGRITFFGYPGQDKVYYTIEKFDSEYALLQAYTSEDYESFDDIPDDIDELIDITAKFIC